MGKIEWLIFFLLIGVMVFLYENYRSHTRLSFNRFFVQSEKIPEAFHNKKIAFLSDLHNNEFGEENEKILELLEKEQPDYIFIGGDMLVSKIGSDFKTALTILKKLADKYPVYCGNGNHEARLLWRAEENPESGLIYDNYIDSLKKAGIHHLYNETIRIYNSSEYIYLSELELSRAYYKKFSSRELPVSHIEEQIGECQKESYHILLAHNPAYFDSYAEWGADLTLSGHVHGGIMRLPFFGGVINPSYHLFPKYDAGLFEKEKKKMIISVGLGSHSIKVRLFNPPKIDMITLKSC